MTHKRLEGRTAVITGAADGVGFGIAARMAEDGASVIIADFDTDKGRQAASSLEAGGARAVFVHCDATNKGSVEAAVGAALDRFGSVDILVNNAYRGLGYSRIEDKTDEVMQYGIDISLFAAKWSMLAAFPHMKARHWGRIINVASLNGVNAHMYSAEYNVGKEALRAYTRTAAREWAALGITANIICPAAESAAFRRFKENSPENAKLVEAQNPMGRIGDPQADIGGVAVFLASEDARYLTGNTLFVDGGSHINGVAWAPQLDAKG